ncbi:MAG TPA: hypothetical protein VFY71_18025 [Planctomycetota bacterium]|nr:hypothetical protein [Planctomycetota bacterium]
MTPLRAALTILVLAGTLAAQQPYPQGPKPMPPTPAPAPKPPKPAPPAKPKLPESDPRNVPDPRDVPDPRKAADPRGTPQDPYAQLEGEALYDALYDAGEDGRLAQVLKEDGWNILAYIDKHCEGWMALLENGADQTPEGKAKLEEMQAKGLKLAALADNALGDTRFTSYVTNFYAWDADQRKSFREGQDLYRKGAQLAAEAKSPQEAQYAMTSLQQSLEHSRPLSDTWGQSMTLSLMGRVQKANGMTDVAAGTMAQARELGRQIRDLPSVWDALAIQYEIAVARRQYQPARTALQEQYLITVDLKDEQAGALITQQLVELDKILGPG